MLTDRNAVGGKAAANYRLAACAPQKHTPRSCRFQSKTACALLQSKKGSAFPRSPSLLGFTINSELIHLVTEAEVARRTLREVLVVVGIIQRILQALLVRAVRAT